MHLVLPKGFHRIRHYGLLANGNRAAYVARARELLGGSVANDDLLGEVGADTDEKGSLAHPCPCCGGRMFVIETFGPGSMPKYHPAPEAIDSS